MDITKRQSSEFEALIAGLDGAITLAEAEQWQTVAEQSADLAELLGRAEHYASLPNGPSPSSAVEIRAILERVDRLRELMAPRHQALAELILRDVNAEKLRKAYGP